MYPFHAKASRDISEASRDRSVRSSFHTFDTSMWLYDWTIMTWWKDSILPLFIQKVRDAGLTWQNWLFHIEITIFITKIPCTWSYLLTCLILGRVVSTQDLKINLLNRNWLQRKKKWEVNDCYPYLTIFCPMGFIICT